jgi:hypothetical protein
MFHFAPLSPILLIEFLVSMLIEYFDWLNFEILEKEAHWNFLSAVWSE